MNDLSDDKGEIYTINVSITSSCPRHDDNTIKLFQETNNEDKLLGKKMRGDIPWLWDWNEQFQEYIGPSLIGPDNKEYQITKIEWINKPGVTPYIKYIWIKQI